MHCGRAGVKRARRVRSAAEDNCCSKQRLPGCLLVRGVGSRCIIMDGGVDRIDNPLASDVESPAAATSLETGTGIITVEQKLAEMEARLQKVADSGGNNVLSTAAALASLASAPTNWHQAMICASFSVSHH